MPVPAMSGAGYFFNACMTPKTTTAIKFSNPMISKAVMLSPPHLLRVGGLAVPLLLVCIVAYRFGIVKRFFQIFFKIFSRPSCAVFFVPGSCPAPFYYISAKAKPRSAAERYQIRPIKEFQKNIFAKSMTNLIS
jgi:hypothetical protein